ncbi:PKD domain-containing protein [Streptomyces canus]|uniref:PKD domain-containing protein n=1 Tax=Streptomyces canus TaxID=58343 RepID=UPI0022524529|nr:PKD domain-containing protein [Streptomyces canus]MCX5255687.1 PKD domain-containing protein [Streptomyces canus]
MASAALSVLLVGCLGAGVAHADTAAGTTLYVDDEAAGCNDTGPGSAAEPFCQIQPAADAAVPGDTVRIAGNSTSYAPVTIRSTGTADAPVSFSAAATGDGSPVTVAGPSPATGITFSGAQYVIMTGIRARAARASALAVEDSQHISYSAAFVQNALADDTTAVIAVDGSSSDISLTRLDIDRLSGLDVTSAAGARNITLADDTFDGGGVSAVGTTGIDFAGDTFWTVCGAIGLTDGSSGSVENTVARSYGTTTCSGTQAELTVDATSAPQVTADYNALNPPSTGTDYDWAGTAYATAQAFRTGTGQGAHDLDQTDLTIPGGGLLAEHSPLIDSADSNAPGELSTDIDGHPRVDDPLVPDTGTGHVDRGATEFQDPFAVSGLDMSAGYVGVPVTADARLSNPWSDSLAGLTYTFDFADGTTVTSTTGSATHTYTQTTSSTGVQATVVVNRADGTRIGAADHWERVEPVPDLTSTVGCRGTSPSAPDTAGCSYGIAFDPYAVTSDRITFGDGSSAVSATGTTGTVKHAYAAPGTYTVTQKITDSGGRAATTTTKAAVGAAFVSWGPTRLLDTRYGTGAPKRPVGPGGVVRLKVLGVGGIPASGVTAVTLNVTDAGATAAGYVSVYPDGTARPSASNLNFRAGQDNPNLVTVRVGADGYVDLYNAHGDVNLIADLAGYYTTTPSSDDPDLSNLVTMVPTRVLDTRYGIGARKGEVGPGSTTTVSVPKDVQGDQTVGAVLNVTVTGGTSSGYVTVACDGPTPPTTSTLNYRAGQTVSNLAVPCAYSGIFHIYNSAGHVHLIADLQGIYTDYQKYGDPDYPSGGGPFVATAPTRFLDTRTGMGASAKPLGANGTLTVKLTKVPEGATAVLVNLTGVAPTANTHLTAYGDGTLPTVSNDNLTAGQTRPVLAVVPVGADGSLRIHNALGSVDVVADLEGYYG